MCGKKWKQAVWCCLSLPLWAFHFDDFSTRGMSALLNHKMKNGTKKSSLIKLLIYSSSLKFLSVIFTIWWFKGAIHGNQHFSWLTTKPWAHLHMTTRIQGENNQDFYNVGSEILFKHLFIKWWKISHVVYFFIFSD